MISSCRCCCRASRSTPAPTTSIRSNRCNCRSSTARRGSCSATSFRDPAPDRPVIASAAKQSNLNFKDLDCFVARTGAPRNDVLAQRLLLRLDHDRRLERKPVPGVEFGVNRGGPVARLGKFDAVHLPQSALDLGSGADDRFACSVRRSKREGQILNDQWIILFGPQSNGGARRPDVAGHDRDIGHASDRMNVNKGGSLGNGSIDRVLMRVARRRHRTEEADNENRREAKRGFGETVAVEAMNGVGTRQPWRKVKMIHRSECDHRRKQSDLDENELPVGCREKIIEGSDFVPAVDESRSQQCRRKSCRALKIYAPQSRC